MSYLGNLPVFDHKTCEWAIFKSRLTQFLKVNSVEDNCSAVLITHLSDESYRLLRNLAYPEDIDGLSYEHLISLLDKHFKTKRCTFADKAKFFGATRNIGESLGDWAARLRGLAIYCDFGSALESNLRDLFVIGLGSCPERDKLFEQNPSTLTFAQALELAEQAASAREAKMVVVEKEPVYPAQFEVRFRSAGASGGGISAADISHLEPIYSGRSEVGCAACGSKSHLENKCRFKNHKCNKCGKKGHLRKMCSDRVNNIDKIAESEDNNTHDVECEECQLFEVIRHVN